MVGRFSKCQQLLISCRWSIMSKTSLLGVASNANFLTNRLRDTASGTYHNGLTLWYLDADRQRFHCFCKGERRISSPIKNNEFCNFIENLAKIQIIQENLTVPLLCPFFGSLQPIQGWIQSVCIPTTWSGGYNKASGCHLKNTKDWQIPLRWFKHESHISHIWATRVRTILSIFQPQVIKKQQPVNHRGSSGVKILRQHKNNWKNVPKQDNSHWHYEATPTMASRPCWLCYTRPSSGW